jgi:Macrophage killing protein with similarity to conjugation protein.
MKRLALAIVVAMAALAPAHAHAASTFADGTVATFAQNAYKSMYTLDSANVDQQLAEARLFFDTDGKHESYVQSLKASGNYNVVRDMGLSMSVQQGNAKARQIGNGKWEVAFPAEMAFVGPKTLRQCLSVTMNLNETETGLSVVNAISTDGECLEAIKD